MADSIIDCETGRRLGCGTFCCRLLVRYDEIERPIAANGSMRKNCVDKAPDGLCVYLDRSTNRCGIWDKRPRVCKEYNCNDDPMLQVALRVSVKGIVQLSRFSLNLNLPREIFIRIPEIACAGSEEKKLEKE